MTVPPATTCPACGVPTTGAFCSACGAAAGPRACKACGAALSPRARFCHRCGQAAGLGAAAGLPGARGRSERAAWIVAGVAVVLLLAAIVAKVVSGRTGADVPDMANAGNAGLTAAAPFAGDPGGVLPTGRAPDISKLSPAERFLRLNNRIMDAANRADSSTVVNFTPMALAAYTQLDTVTNDERYHVAILHAQVGQIAEAQALADTMLQVHPGYLLAYVVRGVIAGFQEDSTALRAAHVAFLKHYAAEIAARRPEYADHAGILGDFKKQAETK